MEEVQRAAGMLKNVQQRRFRSTSVNVSDFFLNQQLWNPIENVARELCGVDLGLKMIRNQQKFSKIDVHQ